jgi:hypothetical protein
MASAADKSAAPPATVARDREEPNGENGPPREKFLPVTRYALVDRLTRPGAWPPGKAAEARRFFKYLDYWRRQRYATQLMALEQDYEPFNPDSDLLVTRKFADAERAVVQKRVVAGIEKLLQQANYTRVDPSNVEAIMTKDSAYGLDLYVEMAAFEELLIYYRGMSSRRDSKRRFRKFWRKEEFDTPIFRRVFVLFKLKPDAVRIVEVCKEKGCDRDDAERIVARARGMIASEMKPDNIYMKMFKNMPRSDMEMAFPNTRVKFRLLDKVKLGVTGGAGLGVGAFSAAGKIALAASNPIAAAGAVAGLGGIAFRQAVNFMNQRQKYMVVMAQNLYFHAMADNRGVMVKLADRAAEEDVKEEMLLYTIVVKEAVWRSDLEAVDRAIEDYLFRSFGVTANFDIADALERLIADGVVVEEGDGRLRALPPKEAAARLDSMWDRVLDDLPDFLPSDAGEEYEGDDSGGPVGGAG